MWDEEMWGRRRRQRHGGHGVLYASMAQAQRRRYGVGQRRPGFQVLLLFVPHCGSRSTPGPAPSPRASINHANALHGLDALSGERAVGVAQSLDGGSFSVGGHERLDAMVLTPLCVSFWKRLPIVHFIPTQTSLIIGSGAHLTRAGKVSPVSHRSAVSHNPQLAVFVLLLALQVRRRDLLPLGFVVFQLRAALFHSSVSERSVVSVVAAAS